MAELYELTAREMVRLVRAGEVSRRELVNAHLERIARVNGAVNAVVELRAEEALAEAEAADRDAAGRTALPLDGVPITIKDHFDVARMKRTEGVRTLADRRSPADAVAVRRLRAAGAIIVGKCNQPDFQIRWNTISDLYGPTRNPRDLKLTAGGSSGGDAAAVAAGMAAIGLGADYGGSIRVPAAFCGIYGVRPSAGRVPDGPTLPPFDGPPTLDHMASVGPLSRSLDDLWLALRVLAGSDPSDPATIPIPLAERNPGQRPKVARMARQTGAIVEPELDAALEQAARILSDAGYEVVDAGIPCAQRAPEIWAELVGTELLNFSMPVWGPQMGESGRQHIETMFSLWDIGANVERYISLFTERRAVARETAVWMEEHPLVLAPIAGMPTPPLDFDHFLSVEETRSLFDCMRNVIWVNLLSLPSVALPTGIQIVARRFHEEEAFDAAAVIERALKPVSIAQPDAGRS